MTPEEADKSAAISRTLAEVMIIICKNHIVQSSSRESLAINEVYAAINALIVEMMHTLYKEEHIKDATDNFCKMIKYAMYLMDQSKEGESNV